MDKRARMLTVMLSLTLLVSLTLACLPGLPDLGEVVTDEETPAPPPPEGDTPVPPPPEEGTPAPPPPAGETPAPPPPGEEWPFELDMEALNDLDSYAYAFHLEGLGTIAGTVEHTVLDIEGQRQTSPTRAEELSFSSVTDGESTSTGFIYIEEQNKMWVREEGGEWEEMPILDPAMLSLFDSFSMFSWWNMLFVGDPQDVQYLGQEMMNGVQSHHYRATESTSWGFAVGCTFAAVDDDIWVAVDGSFPVKRQFDAAGECQGESGEIHFLMEVSNINQPVSISPPM